MSPKEESKTKEKTETFVRQEKAKPAEYEVLIVGGGIAGMTAAIYTARAEREVILLESQIPGGRITTTELVENWPTHLRISGMALGESLTKQVEKFGVKIEWGYVQKISKLDNTFVANLEDGRKVLAQAVIIATGVKPKKINIPGEKEFHGRGVSYCATCDGAFYKNKKVIVVGGGDAAVKEAIFLTKYASKVTIIHRRSELRAEKIVAREAMENSKIEILWDTLVTEIIGEGKTLTGVKIQNVRSQQTARLNCDGIFLYVGNRPEVEAVKDLVKLSEEGYIIAGEDTKTNIPGLFAAGDVRTKELRQLVTAAADGAVAAVMADTYLERLANG